MALILNIDTATEHASVCISDNSVLLAFEESNDQKNHATFIQPAIQKIFSSINLSLSAVDAIAVTSGPGSYTGLRVGLSTAKGLCFALNKPLLTLNTLEVMAVAVIEELQKKNIATTNLLFCPMIDARRMEVFTAIFDETLQTIMPPTAMIVDTNSFADYFSKQKIVFSGTGSIKCKRLLEQENVAFSSMQYNSTHMIKLSEKQLVIKKFSDLAYSEPFYLKEFFSPQKK